MGLNLFLAIVACYHLNKVITEGDDSFYRLQKVTVIGHH